MTNPELPIVTRLRNVHHTDYATRLEAAALITEMAEALRHIVGAANEAPKFGPYDQIDNSGNPYQSQDFANGLDKARAILAKATP